MPELTEAERVIELHRRTGSPVLDCQEAIRSGRGVEYLRECYRDEIIRVYGSLTAVTWRYPTGLEES